MPTGGRPLSWKLPVQHPLPVRSSVGDAVGASVGELVVGNDVGTDGGVAICGQIEPRAPELPSAVKHQRVPQRPLTFMQDPVQRVPTGGRPLSWKLPV